MNLGRLCKQGLVQRKYTARNEPMIYWLTYDGRRVYMAYELLRLYGSSSRAGQKKPRKGRA